MLPLLLPAWSQIHLQAGVPGDLPADGSQGEVQGVVGDMGSECLQSVPSLGIPSMWDSSTFHKGHPLVTELTSVAFCSFSSGPASPVCEGPRAPHPRPLPGLDKTFNVNPCFLHVSRVHIFLCNIRAKPKEKHESPWAAALQMDFPFLLAFPPPPRLPGLGV